MCIFAEASIVASLVAFSSILAPLRLSSNSSVSLKVNGGDTKGTGGGGCCGMIGMVDDIFAITSSGEESADLASCELFDAFDASPFAVTLEFGGKMHGDVDNATDDDSGSILARI